MKRIPVTIKSAAWVKKKNSYMSIDSQYKTFFPDDSFIPRGTGKEHGHLIAERGINLAYQGGGEPVRCLLELRDSGKFRPTNRGAIKAFYEDTGATVGDSIVFEKTGERSYSVQFVKNPS